MTQRFMTMIIVTKLDNRKILLNLETVKYLESVPDTLISFVNGESLMVRESLEEVQQAVIQYQQNVLNQAEVRAH